MKSSFEVSIHLSQSEDMCFPSEFIHEAADCSKNFQAFLENYNSKENNILNVHLLCNIHFVYYTLCYQ